MMEDEYVDDVFWGMPENAPNFNSDARFISDDEFDEEPPYRGKFKSPTILKSKSDESGCMKHLNAVGQGHVSGCGTGEDIANAVSQLMAYGAVYHYEFKFWKMGAGGEPTE